MRQTSHDTEHSSAWKSDSMHRSKNKKKNITGSKDEDVPFQVQGLKTTQDLHSLRSCVFFKSRYGDFFVLNLKRYN